MKKLIVTVMFTCVFLFSGMAHAELIAHWSFNNENNIGYDDTGNGHSLTAFGDPIYEDGAVMLDGVDDYFESSDPVFALQSDFTLVAMIKIEAYSGNEDRIFCKRYDTWGYGYALTLDGDGRLQAWWEYHNNIISPDPIPLNEWVTVGMTWDASTLEGTMFINNDSWSIIADRPLATTSYPFRLGSQTQYSGGAAHFSGLIDDAKIYNSVEPVPEPATMLLLGSGLAGLAGFRRKFKNR